MVGGGGEQPVHVGVAAHDAVQHDHIGRLHVRGAGRDVEDEPVDAATQPGLVSQRPQCSS